MGFDPAAFRPNDKIDRIVLGLALACNDMRDCHWVVHQLDKAAPAVPKFGIYDGACLGMRLWASRYLAGAAHEVLVALKKNQRLLDNDADIRAALDQLTPKGAARWKALNELARASEQKQGERRFLCELRNNLSFHYHDPKRLADGYRDCFFDGPSTEFNELAWASTGAGLKNFRFYFVDAAAQQAERMATKDYFGSTEESRLSALVETVVKTLVNFVTAFVAMRVARLTPHR